MTENVSVLFLYGVQVQAYIISSLKKEMPSVFGKDSKKKELIANLGEIYHKIEKEHQISPGDFPNLAKMQVRLKTYLVNVTTYTVDMRFMFHLITNVKFWNVLLIV